MPDMDKAAVYRIRVRGVLDQSWSDRLGGMQVSVEAPGTVTLVGRLLDQAALAGVLETLYELHLAVLEVRHLSENEK